MGTVIVTLGMGAGLAGTHYCINLIILHSIGLSHSSCPFQTPFWFKKAPELKPVLDEFGNTIPDQVWIEFGPMQNHKCVDYFRVESAKTDKYGLTKITSPHIDRNQPGTKVTVVPCTLYKFRVAAYEMFHGTGKIFPVWSKEVNFTLDYTPKFIVAPLVYEKVASKGSKVRNQVKRSIYPYTTTPAPTTTEPFLIITIVWELSYIDFPICLDRVEFQYLNIEWDESQYTKVFNGTKHREAFIVHNKQLPCDDEYAFTVKVFGVNGQYTNTTWDPPSCVSTTPAPTTPPPTPPDFQRCHPGVSFVFYYLYCMPDY